MRRNDFDLDEPLTCEVVAETIGARRSLVVRLARQGLIETLESKTDEPLLPRRAIVQLRRMQRFPSGPNSRLPPLNPTEPMGIAAPVIRLIVTRLDEPSEAPPVRPYMVPLVWS